MKLSCKRKEGFKRRQDRDNLKSLGKKQKKKRWLGFLKRRDLLLWKVQKSTIEIFIARINSILFLFLIN